MLAIIENKWGIKYIQILPAPTEVSTENIGEGLRFLEIYSMLKIFLKNRFIQNTRKWKYWKIVFKIWTAFLGPS